jgi:hypothetical protein
MPRAAVPVEPAVAVISRSGEFEAAPDQLRPIGAEGDRDLLLVPKNMAVRIGGQVGVSIEVLRRVPADLLPDERSAARGPLGLVGEDAPRQHEIGHLQIFGQLRAVEE